MSALLEISGLEVAYGMSQVLFGLDLHMNLSEAATLLGRNGMGKTTTLRAICGLQAIKGGTIRFAGERIDGWRPDRIGRAGIALVPEGRLCFPNLTVDEHLVAFFAGAHHLTLSKRPAWKPVSEWLGRLSYPCYILHMQLLLILHHFTLQWLPKSITSRPLLYLPFLLLPVFALLLLLLHLE